MLDTEPTEPTETTAPAKKAARKAPAKRAPRKTAAQKAAEAASLTEQPQTAETPAPAGPTPVVQVPETLAEAPEVATPAEKPKKATRPRKAAAKKTAAKPAPDEAAADQSLVEQPVLEAPVLEAPAVEAPAAVETPAPAKRTPRKRVSKAAAAAAAAAEPETVPVITPEPAPALAPPAVLFQPPVESKPTTRRRRGASSGVTNTAAPKPDAVEAPAEQADLLAEVPLEIDADSVTDEAAELADETAETTDSPDADEAGDGGRRRRRRGRRGRGSRATDDAAETTSDTSETEPAAETDADADAETETETEGDHADEVAEAALSASARRRRRRRRSTGADADAPESEDDPPNTVVHVREPGSRESARDSGRDSGRGRGGTADDDGVRGVKGSTRLEAKRQRRRDNRDTGRKRAPILTEAEFLARREAVDRVMAVRQSGDRTQIAVLEDDILVEHYVTRASASSAVGNVYLGRVQNVLPSMEAAFIDIGRGRNGVLYAGEVNWDSAGLEGKARSIENALNPGDTVLVQVTKDPIGHKGARLTSQISLPGRFVVYVPGGGMTGISRKLPDVERSRLKAILKKVVPDEAGVIVRTAAEGASEEDLVSDVERLKTEWESISRKAGKTSDGPTLVHGEPDLAIRVVRDIFNDDFSKLVVAGSDIHAVISGYVADIAPDLAERIHLHTGDSDLFRDLRVDEQLMKALDRKVWLPSGGSLVIDRTEAMTVVDVNTGKYTGSGGNLEQTVTRNNLEAAEEIVRQLRLRDIGGIVVIDFIDMVLESNRDLVLRRLTECLGRDRTKHQVAEVTSLGLVQMTRKRVGEGLLEAFSEPCEHCKGRGVIVHLDPVEKSGSNGNSAPQNTGGDEERTGRGGRRGNRKAKSESQPVQHQPDAAELAAEAEKRRAAASAVAAIAAATNGHADESPAAEPATPEPATESGALKAASRSRQRGRELTPTTEAVPESVRTPEPAAAPQAAATEQAAVPEQAEAIDRFPTEDPTVKAPARPRRRRAASRPAGPPVGASTAGE